MLVWTIELCHETQTSRFDPIPAHQLHQWLPLLHLHHLLRLFSACLHRLWRRALQHRWIKLSKVRQSCLVAFSEPSACFWPDLALSCVYGADIRTDNS
jgi:hypothetical protein